MAEASVDFPLIHASAEQVPLPDAGFDIVFCDHGAMTFADPVSEPSRRSARLLRPGGLFAFNHHSPIRVDLLAAGCRRGRMIALGLDYFGLHHVDDGDGHLVTNCPTAEWIRLFPRQWLRRRGPHRAAGPRPNATSSYRSPSELAWARRWPARGDLAAAFACDHASGRGRPDVSPG
jgi:SAM-dependent methyltransferase